MPSRNEIHPLCWFCQKQPATVRYVHPQLSEMVCTACLDRLEVQDAYEHHFVHILELEEHERYDDALADLDKFLEANRHRDHDQWLARSIARDRASILFNAGRDVEAEETCQAWARLGFRDAHDRWMHGFQTAEVLDALGRPREALAALEDALGHQERKYLPSAPLLLVEIVNLSKKLGQPVNSKWRRLAEAVAGAYGVDMPIEDSLGESILVLKEIIRTKKPRPPDEWATDEPMDLDRE